MSRVGKKQIEIPKDVTITLTHDFIAVKGKHGNLERVFDSTIISIEQIESSLKLSCLTPSKKNNSYHGLMRALVQNMVTGVSEQFTKTLIAEGVGYKFQIDKNNLVINAGYSHPVEFPIPSDLTLKTESPTKLLITGIDKEKVGFLASKIHDVRPPEPYKGKGLLYQGEKIRRKAGKTGK